MLEGKEDNEVEGMMLQHQTLPPATQTPEGAAFPLQTTQQLWPVRFSLMFLDEFNLFFDIPWWF